MRDVVLTALTLTAVLFLALGFIADTPRYARRLMSAGSYWTGGATCLLPVALLLDAPTHVVVLNFLALTAAAVWWAVDVTWGAEKS